MCHKCVVIMIQANRYSSYKLVVSSCVTTVTSCSDQYAKVKTYCTSHCLSNRCSETVPQITTLRTAYNPYLNSLTPEHIDFKMVSISESKNSG